MAFKIVKMGFNRLMLMQFGGITASLLKDVLNLMPEDTVFVGCGADLSVNIDYLLFTSDSFANVEQGQSIPEIVPYFRKNNDGSVFIERIDFGNLGDTKSCTHSWATHFGLRDNYDYCTICNIRRNS